MTTDTTGTTVPPVLIDTDRPGVPMTRLVRVEWRKMTDTLAGRWLMVVIFSLLVLAVGITLLTTALNDDFEPTAELFASVLQFLILLVAPVFAITITTSEWSQRTHLTAFSLEPKRGRVLAAKFLAVAIFAVVTLGVAVALGSLGNTLVGAIGGDVVWDFSAEDLGWSLGLQFALILSAFALGLLFLNSAVAVAIFYVSAIMLRFIVFPILFEFFERFLDIAPFLDLFFGFRVAASNESLQGDPVGLAGRVGPLACACLIWIVIPGVLGVLRALRSEIK